MTERPETAAPLPERSTAEGHTPEKPHPSEVGKPGAPGPPDHAAGGHMDAHATISEDDHSHAEARLGPVDWAAWGYAALGVVAGLVVVLAFWVAVA